MYSAAYAETSLQCSDIAYEPSSLMLIASLQEVAIPDAVVATQALGSRSSLVSRRHEPRHWSEQGRQVVFSTPSVPY